MNYQRDMIVTQVKTHRNGPSEYRTLCLMGRSALSAMEIGELSFLHASNRTAQASIRLQCSVLRHRFRKRRRDSLQQPAIGRLPVYGEIAHPEPVQDLSGDLIVAGSNMSPRFVGPGFR